MSEKLGILCGVGSPRLAKPDSFFSNLRNFPAKHELIVYSEYNWSKQWPRIYKLNASVEVAKTEKNRMSVHNLVFLAGLRIAAAKRFTHVMIYEQDCRVNVSGWDDIIWQELLKKNRNAISGGTLVVFNPHSYNRQAAENFETLLAESRANRLLPIPVFGTAAPGQPRESNVFPVGAFSIHRMDWLLKTFPEALGTPQEYIGLAQSIKVWDYEIGTRLWAEFKEETYNKVVNLESIYSGYGNVICSEEERKQWLEEKMVVGIHQIKSNWPGPEPKPETPLTDRIIPGIHPEAKSTLTEGMTTVSKL